MQYYRLIDEDGMYIEELMYGRTAKTADASRASVFLGDDNAAANWRDSLLVVEYLGEDYWMRQEGQPEFCFERPNSAELKLKEQVL